MRILLSIPLLLTPLAALAQREFSLEPVAPQSGQEVRVRFDSSSGCLPAEWIEVGRNLTDFSVIVHGTDVSPCQREWRTPRYASLGVVFGGTYSVQITMCGNPPPPEPACSVVATLPLIVAGAPARQFTVPALSTWAGCLTVGLVLLAGWLRQR